MQALMMDTPLRIIDLLRHAATNYPQQQIISRRQEGDIHSTTYAATWKRSAQLARALQDLGVRQGDCIASLAWNTYRHVELYYGVSGYGAVLHTVNPRLFSEQIEYIIQHADDSYVFVDLDFVGMLEHIAPQLPHVKGYIVLTDRQHMPETSLPDVHCYEDLIAGYSDTYAWPEFDENQAALLCYTSGTTGNPKGVLYSHRAMVLHAQATVSESLLGLRSHSVLMPMVAMYHAGAWGAPYAAPLAGCKLVLPGSGMQGDAVWELIREHKVDIGLGVPTVWLTLHNYLQNKGITDVPLQRVCVGGAASPMGLVRAYHEYYNVYWQPIWGMTETGPLATSTPPTADIMALPLEQRFELQTTAGRAAFGVEMDIFDAENQPLPHDGESSGELRVRGPWICSQYFKHEDLSSFPDGWLATGDIAVINPQGYMRVVDRKKDVIKSGGEWISSLEIEDLASQHPMVNESCVIGVKHPKWDERPLLLIITNPGYEADKQSLYDFLKGKIAKWWTPDDIIFVDQLPHTGTGKLLKNKLRDQYINYLIEQGKTT
ncbi:long-chain fatty acid--CoA ligase [Aliidiomarina minuta]|uniref:Long-chain fatty acid--CoA ligase n=1 Tax=Aliidiomarina minuta TaxID=880057 RepID=A0A432W4R7_9GAMM|nr:long-chain fatty acid--CoA ligase [Aliidiomarina minuta]RUO24397.1 long-chain fatty acid--CoA ligase [Aliidiomarina minuta]